jgi:hypothetical protein
MRLELESACNFIVHLIRIKKQNICESQLSKFNRNILELLKRRYRDHWFPDKPLKGAGYRCIRFNDYAIDPLIVQAGESSGLSKEFLRQNLPNDFIMWVDPLDVSYRIEEYGCTYSIFDKHSFEAWKHKTPCKCKTKRNQVAPYTETVRISESDYLYPFNKVKKTLSMEQLASYCSIEYLKSYLES